MNLDRTALRTLHVVDMTGNLGGGTRFVRSLLPALRRARPDLEISFFGTDASLSRGDVLSDLNNAGIRTRRLGWYEGMNWRSQGLRRRVAFKVRRRMGREGEPIDYVRRNFARAIDGADVTYFPWPYHFGVPVINSAMVATIHDLNFKYFFGSPIFAAQQASALDTQVRQWLGAASTVTSSEFMSDEIKRFYPDSPPSRVIRLTSFSARAAAPSESPSVGVPRLTAPYVLSANNVTVHKNLGTVIAAQALLRQRFPEVRLVLAGAGTEAATGRSTALGATYPDESGDVIGLGYVSNDEIDRLIDGAAVVVNASLYEAGNGPGVDAWSRGTPVAMSDIPSFREHLVRLGVAAALFDPRDPKDIAAKIADVLENRSAWTAAVEQSKTAMNARTWDHVAHEYIEVFEGAHRGRSDG